VLDDVEHTLRDDPLASAWYRAQLLPHLVERVLADLQETR
jgi:CO/xanthine dehydrogenase FAD-binding subunit